MLPYAARRYGAGDCAGIRRGLREAGVAAAIYSMLIVGPVLVLGAPWLARLLTESPTTTNYATFALRTVPLACLVSVPFFLSRPVFEAMQRGKPGLVMALVRYAVLTGPCAWLGLLGARQLGQPPIHGLTVGGKVDEDGILRCRDVGQIGGERQCH